MKNKKIVVIGATSAIAQAMIREFADTGNELFLVARNELHLKTIASDAAIRSQKPCHTALFDALRNEHIHECVEATLSALSEIDIVVIAHGTLPNQKQCQQQVEKTLEEFQINAVSYIGLMTAFSSILEKQKKGQLVVFGSCAGDRGRASNYLYGSAKSAIATFAAGLRAYLYPFNIKVLIVKPGFVDTPMTKDFKKGILWATPEFVASAVIRAIDGDAKVIYVPGFWRYVMKIIKRLPESMMRRL